MNKSVFDRSNTSYRSLGTFASAWYVYNDVFLPFVPLHISALV